AVAVSTRNGYPNSGRTSVTVEQLSKKSRIQVTVCSNIDNSFGAIYSKNITICRSAVADFTGPAPMGSPCNTFGDEPTAGGGTDSPTPSSGTSLGSSIPSNCMRDPQFWATVAGPGTDKSNGDRFQAATCNAG